MLRITLRCSCAKRMPDFLINFWYSIVKLQQRFLKTARSQESKIFQGCWNNHSFSSMLLGLEPEWKWKSKILSAGIACETRAPGSAEVRGYNKHLSKVVKFYVSQKQQTGLVWALTIGKSIATGEDRRERCKMSEGWGWKSEESHWWDKGRKAL